MATDSHQPETTTLAPDEAFAVLGNETRMEILQALGEGDAPIPFSELRERIGVRDSGQFNYHLGKLEGHFVRKTDAGYSLRQAGNRVIEAILSGAVTETVVLEPTRLDIPCPFCGADIEVSYREERLLVRCTECGGSFGDVEPSSPALESMPPGTLTLNYLPSAGFQGRSPGEVLDTTLAWTYAQHVLVANDVCSRCSGTIEHSVDVCSDHQPDGTICDQCHTRFAVKYVSRCTNCNYEKRGGFSHHLLGDSRVRAFFEAREIDPLAPAYNGLSPIYDYEEEVLSTDPFEVRVTFSVGGDELVVLVDDALRVSEVFHRGTSE